MYSPDHPDSPVRYSGAPRLARRRSPHTLPCSNRCDHQSPLRIRSSPRSRWRPRPLPVHCPEVHLYPKAPRRPQPHTSPCSIPNRTRRRSNQRQPHCLPCPTRAPAQIPDRCGVFPRARRRRFPNISRCRNQHLAHRRKSPSPRRRRSHPPPRPSPRRCCWPVRYSDAPTSMCPSSPRIWRYKSPRCFRCRRTDPSQAHCRCCPLRSPLARHQCRRYD